MEFRQAEKKQFATTLEQKVFMQYSVHKNISIVVIPASTLHNRSPLAAAAKDICVFSVTSIPRQESGSSKCFNEIDVVITIVVQKRL